jgi:prepilin-type processing-associated H-X9-DG protein
MSDELDDPAQPSADGAHRLDYSPPREPPPIRTTITLSHVSMAMAAGWVFAVAGVIIFRGKLFLIVACAAAAAFLALAARQVAPANDTEARRVARRTLWIGLLPAAITLGSILLWLPSRHTPYEPAYRPRCASNLRQIGQALQMYANDYPGALPPSFDYLITREDIEADAFVCPASSDAVARGPTTQAVAATVVGSPGHCSYIYAGAGLSSQSLTPQHILAYEPMTNHGNDGMNVLFGDGRVEFVGRWQADHVLSELAIGHNPPR